MASSNLAPQQCEASHDKPETATGLFADAAPNKKDETIDVLPEQIEDKTCNPRRRTRRKRQRSVTQQDLERFQIQHDSLRVSASNVAAMVGLNPFKDLPEVLLKLVYQGSVGQVLLARDASLLGLQLVSKEQSLHELAQAAGPTVVQALHKVLQVQSGARPPVASVQEATRLKQGVVEAVQAAANEKKIPPLTALQCKVLQEGTRAAVDTSYGTFHEEAALVAYEAQTGWPVRERNEQVRVWPFGMIDDGEGKVVPLAPAAEQVWESYREEEEELSMADQEGKSPPETDANKRVKTLDLTNDDENDDDEIKVPDKSNIDASIVHALQPRPYFSILGSVDGIRDELAPKNNSCQAYKNGEDDDDDDDDDDDSWALQQVVVEVKHRMKRLQSVPPLYDQIQAVIYCHMYQVNQADLVQVMRSNVVTIGPVKKSSYKKQAPDTTGMKPLDGWLDGDNNNNNNNNNKAESGAVQQKDPTEGPSSDQVLKTTSSMLGQEEGREEKKTHETPAIPTAEREAAFRDSGILSEAVTAATEIKPLVQEIASSTTQVTMSVDAVSMNPIVIAIPTTGRVHESLVADASEMSAQQVVVDVDAQPRKEDTSPATTKVTIKVDRISLDDPVWQHRKQWNETILPRLRSFVDAVYAIRSNDDKRYRLLASMADSTAGSTNSSASIPDNGAWKVLHEECPWLVQCDTAFYRD